MAYIVEKGGKVRVQVECGGMRASKTFKSRADAEQWAATQERLIEHRHQARVALADSTLLSLVPRRMLQALEDIPYTHDDIVRTPFSYEVSSGVYFLIKGGEVVYVGQSLDMLNRISKHRREGKWFDSFNMLPCRPDQLDALEEKSIVALLPRLNATLSRRAAALEADCAPA